MCSFCLGVAARTTGCGNWLSNSVPVIHLHVAATLSNQSTRTLQITAVYVIPFDRFMQRFSGGSWGASKRNEDVSICI